MGSGGDGTLLAAVARLEAPFLAELAWAMARGRPRSLAEDVRRALRRLDRPLRVEGTEHVPPRSPFMLVANHYQAPGLWIGWVAAAITAVVAESRDPAARELHWLVTSEWRWFEVGGRWVPNPLTAVLFPRACRVWGLIPTPPRPADVAGRARSLRAILSYLSESRRAGHLPEPVALFPEGRATVALAEARPGSGAFLCRIVRRGVPLLPAGAFQEQDTLVIRFGPPFSLTDAPPGESADHAARRQVMSAIGRLLPPALWGAYAAAIAAAD